MPLESKWANAPDEVETRHKTLRSNRSNNGNKPNRSLKKGSSQKIICNDSTNRIPKKDSISASYKSEESKMNQSSKLELLKQKIEEQKNILKAKHKEQQQKLLEDFLNDDSSTFNWEDSIDDEEELLKRINKL